MNTFDVKIVDLEPMRIASVRVISPTPELDSWKWMRNFADSNNLLGSLDLHPVFGFNNPNPSPDKKEYGYEFWIKLDRDMDYGTTEGVEFTEFEGGKFAVATSILKEDVDVDGFLKTWKKLISWSNDSEYTKRDGPHLEKPLNPDVLKSDMVLDLYLPIE